MFPQSHPHIREKDITESISIVNIFNDHFSAYHIIFNDQFLYNVTFLMTKFQFRINRGKDLLTESGVQDSQACLDTGKHLNHSDILTDVHTAESISRDTIRNHR